MGEAHIPNVWERLLGTVNIINTTTDINRLYLETILIEGEVVRLGEASVHVVQYSYVLIRYQAAVFGIYI